MMKQLDEYHSYEEIAPNTYRIDEKGYVNCYLIKGSDKSLLIDAGWGVGNLLFCVKQLSDKPIILAVTHRHPDHMGAAWQFGSYYADAKDMKPVYDLLCMRLLTEQAAKKFGASISNKPSLFQHTKVIPVKEDQVFDLGDRMITIRNVPGHTRGSLIYLDEANKLMFTGDDLNPSLWMHLPGCTSLADWLAGAAVIRDYAAKGYTAFYGHGDGRQDIAQMDITIHLVHEIIEMHHNGTLPKGKHLYPKEDEFPNVYYNSKNIE